MFCTQAGPGCSTIAELAMAQAPGHILGTRTGSHQCSPPRAPWAAKPPGGEPRASPEGAARGRGSPRTFYIQTSALPSSRLGGARGRREEKEVARSTSTAPHPHQEGKNDQKKMKNKQKHQLLPASRGHCEATAAVPLPGCAARALRGKAPVESRQEERLCHKNATSPQE